MRKINRSCFWYMFLWLVYIVVANSTIALEQLGQQQSRQADPSNQHDCPVNLVILPQVDPTRVDDLGWTDAHHAAYGSAITTTSEGVDNIIAQENARAFLEQSNLSSEFFCQPNDFGQIPLHLAVRQNNLDVVSFFVDRKLDCLDTGNGDGDTPLHYAAAWGRKEAAEILLLQGGVAPTIQNHAGQTPMDDAISYDHNDIWTLMNTVLETSQVDQER